MVINNHSGSNKKKLDLLLRQENISGSNVALSQILEYARFMADIEKVLVVVSDMKDGRAISLPAVLPETLNWATISRKTRSGKVVFFL